MTKKEIELAETIAEMEGDTKAIIRAFSAVIEDLGINLEDFKKSDDNQSMKQHELELKSKLPKILGGLTRTVMSGGLGKIMPKLMALAPILTKYRHLS